MLTVIASLAGVAAMIASVVAIIQIFRKDLGAAVLSTLVAIVGFSITYAINQSNGTPGRQVENVSRNTTTTAEPTEIPPRPEPGPCDTNILQEKHQQLASDIAAGNADEAGSHAQDLMNAENDCATSLGETTAAARHYVESATASIYGAVYGVDMFGLKKQRLEYAQTVLQSVVAAGKADPQTEKRAEDMLQSATEKLDAINSQ